jgi:hypothetical protein
MCPFKKITDWERKNFDVPKSGDAEKRKEAETETFNDLSKDIQQLLCDAHEEFRNPNPADRLLGINKRMVALLTITAYEARRTNRLMIFLTLIILFLTGLLVFRDFTKKEPSRSEQEPKTSQNAQP